MVAAPLTVMGGDGRESDDGPAVAYHWLVE
jgi:hypothetical protein